MANNIKGNAPNSVVAKSTISFISAGITSDNTVIIYLVDDPLKSYMPGRAINGISGFVQNQGYYLVAKVDMDLSAIVVPPVTELTQLGTPGSFTATPASSSQINLSWSAVTDATTYVVDRATNSGFTTGVTSGIYSGGGTSFNDGGRSADTTYYYRIRATAVGFADSNYATANGTTSGSLVDLTFTLQSGTITESPAHTFDGAGDAYMKADQTLASGALGWFQSDIQGIAAETYGLGLDNNSTNNFYPWAYYCYCYSGHYYFASTGTEGATNDTGVAYTAGDKMRLRRGSGGQIFFEYTSDGTTWNSLHTFAATNTGVLYAKVGFASVTSGGTIVNPKGNNFS